MKYSIPVRVAAVAAALLLPLSACGGDAEEVNAQTSPVNELAEGAALGAAAEAIDAPPPPQFTAADTATRTVGEALSEYTPKPDTAAADSAAPRPKYRAGEDPEYARKYGWPVNYPKPLPGSILPDKRIVCYYGNPNSTRMGALGEYPREEMLRRLMDEVERWNEADPEHPAVPCLHMVTVVAQADAGPSGMYRAQMRDVQVDSIYQMIKEKEGIFFIDVQVGQDDIRNLMPRFEEFLKRPDIHFAVDPEFYMRGGVVPGRKIGSITADDINYVTGELARIVRENDLPPKVLVIHRFTQNMVQNYKDILLRPEVQIVMDMDGWGAPWLKRDSYRDYVVEEPVQFTGFKLFYHNDTKKGDPLMTPQDLLKLEPKPLYIQYQ